MVCNVWAHYLFAYCKIWHALSYNGDSELQNKHDNREHKNKVKIQDSKAAWNIVVVS